jgi:hypothetical protein
MFSPGSIFKSFMISRAVDLNDKKFVKRLEQLETHMLENYEVETIPNGWKCTSKKATNPGFVITPDSVIFIMKHLGI